MIKYKINILKLTIYKKKLNLLIIVYYLIFYYNTKIIINIIKIFYIFII